MVEKLIQSVIMAMQDSLDDEQLRMLENVLALNLHGMEIKEECTQLVTSERHWEKDLAHRCRSERSTTARNTSLCWSRQTGYYNVVCGSETRNCKSVIYAFISIKNRRK